MDTLVENLANIYNQINSDVSRLLQKCKHMTYVFRQDQL